MKLHTGSVASTPTVWVEAPGTPVAGITFRVGLADEKLTHRGITSLSMFLLRNELSAKGIKTSYQISAQRTDLYTTGDPIRFVETLCDWLVDPSISDFEEGRRVAQDKPLIVTPVGEHFRVRFGNVGPGRQNLPKLGLTWLQPEQVASWAKQYFNASNSVLWFVGQETPRTGARLPLGSAMDVVPSPQKGPWETPQWVPTDAKADTTVSFSMVFEDRPETVVVRNLLESTVARALSEHNIGHDAPVTSFDSIDNDLGQLHLSVSVDADMIDQALAELRNMLSNLALGGCRQCDVDDAVAESMRRDGELAGLIAYATRAAFNRLLARPTPIPVRRDEVYGRITPATLADLLEQAWTTLVWTSSGVGAPLPDTDCPSITGVSFRGHDNDERLTVGRAGLRYEHGDHVTSVGWRDIEAVVHVADDERRLYAKDGPPLAFCSSDWDDGQDLIGDIDRHLPRSRHIQDY